jgi:succinate dehydrogenase / fumarate reductase cytochrome b subunit
VSADEETRFMPLRTQTADGSRGGMWSWLGQRVTAVLVLVTIAVHLILTHYIAIGELSFADIGRRLGVTAVLLNDIVLLVAVVYHALNGVRMVVLDYGLSGAATRRAFGAALWIVGAVTVGYGVWALWAWVS